MLSCCAQAALMSFCCAEYAELTCDDEPCSAVLRAVHATCTDLSIDTARLRYNRLAECTSAEWGHVHRFLLCYLHLPTCRRRCEHRPCLFAQIVPCFRTSPCSAHSPMLCAPVPCQLSRVSLWRRHFLSRQRQCFAHLVQLVLIWSLASIRMGASLGVPSRRLR